MSNPLLPGRPRPLGATWSGEGVNFALRSSHAEAVELCLFDADGGREIARLKLPERSGDTWHGFLPGAGPGLVYGYRVHGRYAPRQGHRFNKHKLLLDPYARAVTGTLAYAPAIYGYSRGAAEAWRQDISDSAACVPKARVTDPHGFDWLGDRRPRVPMDRSVIYELHVKGFTRQHPDVPQHLRGTYLGLAQPAVVDYLTGLGVTAVELMPVQHFVTEPHLRARGLDNYWGYNTLAFFAPHPGYALADPLREFREMVRRLHDAGIEVILDVVFNHTAEGGEDGPTLSFRGIDNLGYYRLEDEDLRRCVNWSGCGNSLDFGRPAVRELALDCLRYWAAEMRVDGFRFDLATALGRDDRDFDPESAFFQAVAADPLLSGLKLIAEPWDVGPQGYRLGGFPPRWAEWNDRFRDTARAFWRGDPGQVPRLAERLGGSSDLFGAEGRGPYCSVNYVSCHDGFTLADAVSYARKHNDDNGELNRDGDDHAVSWNHGIEGPTEDVQVLRARARQQRNLLATLLLSQGVPMLQAGDEFGRTQRGNNNAYCQDNELAWVNWRSTREGTALARFTRSLIRLRRAHAVFRRQAFLAGKLHSEGRFKDVAWLRADGLELNQGDWHDQGLQTFGMLLDGSGLPPAQAGDGAGDNFLVLFNAGDSPVEFTMPAPISGQTWEVQLDTSQEELTVPAGSYRKGHVYLLAAGTLAVLADHE